MESFQIDFPIQFSISKINDIRTNDIRITLSGRARWSTLQLFSALHIIVGHLTMADDLPSDELVCFGQSVSIQNFQSVVKK